MRHTFLNIASFFKSEKLILFIILICVISSAFILNFSYGLFYHYNEQKNEAEIDLNNIWPEIAEEAVFTKSDLKRYVEALSGDLHDQVLVIYAAGDISEYGFNTDESLHTIAMRFRFIDGEYRISETTREDWEEHSFIPFGRYITDEEESSGKQVALVWGTSEKEWNTPCANIKNDDGTITLFGKKYEVVGVYRAGGGTPIVPFLTVPNDLKITAFSIVFERNITRSLYDELRITALEVIPDTLIFPELELPDLDAIAIYNNMIVIAVIISILSIINFAMLYRFVLKKRQRNLAVLRICGCTKGKAVLIYLAECLILTIPAYAVGMVLNMLCVKFVFGDIFTFITEAYSPEVYAVIAVTYFTVFLILLSGMIFRSVNISIVEEWRE